MEFLRIDQWGEALVKNVKTGRVSSVWFPYFPSRYEPFVSLAEQLPPTPEAVPKAA